MSTTTPTPTPTPSCWHQTIARRERGLRKGFSSTSTPGTPGTPSTPGQSITIIHKNGATSGFEMCFAPNTLRSQPKHVFNPDSVIKKFNRHLIYDWFFQDSLAPQEPRQPLASMACQSYIRNQNGLQATSGFEMCFLLSDPGTKSQRSQPKHASNPDSVIKKFKPHLIYDCFPRPNREQLQPVGQEARVDEPATHRTGGKDRHTCRAGGPPYWRYVPP